VTVGSDEPVISSGSGKTHVGWLVPERTVCLGAGPVQLRFSAEEAAALAAILGEILAEPLNVTPDGGYDYTPCGCDGAQESAAAEPAADSDGRFWGDDGWNSGRIG
jgi:hypothetical protein